MQFIRVSPVQYQAGPHRILIPAKHAQAFGDEGLQRTQGVLACYRPREVLQRSGMAGEVLLYVGHCFARDGVGAYMRRSRRIRRPRFRKRTAILGIEVPAALQRGIALHHDVVSPPHHAVEELETKLLVAARPVGKRAARTQEVRVLTDLQLDVGCPAKGKEALFDAPVARLHDHDDLRTVFPHCIRQHSHQ
jgi:hypothetical protein